MAYKFKLNKYINEILDSDSLFVVQDLDGVCMPLVKDPLKREIDEKYVTSISKLGDEFSVLTCGEHEGERGVNRIIERALKSKDLPKKLGLYLPGLAACGIEYQDKFGQGEVLGLSNEEIIFLKQIPLKMRELLEIEIKNCLKGISEKEIRRQSKVATCDTRFSPAINLNGLFSIVGNNIQKKRELQQILYKVMNKIMDLAKNSGLEDSFHLHISPNLGCNEGIEIMKFATETDIGTTDIQLIVKGALKEAGLLVLLNKYFKNKYSKSPFGSDFNVRNAPQTINQLISLCKANIPKEKMPTIVGVGDTITSTFDNNSNKILRGGSDRGFLTLIQELGKAYDKQNIIIFVDSSHGEVYRPSVSNGDFTGITDKEDILKFNLVMSDGPSEYRRWIMEISERRESLLNSKK